MKKFLLSILISLSILTLPFLVLAQKKNQTPAPKPFQAVLSWSAKTTAPLFYKGKALPIFNSFINVGADVFGDEKENFIFKWSLDEDYQPFSSGKGKDKFVFTATKPVNSVHSVKLEIIKPEKSGKETIIASKKIDIPITEPEIIFYKTDDKSLIPQTLEKEISIEPGQNTAILAEPYFLSDGIFSNFSFEWFVDGNLQKSEETPNVLNINVPSEKPKETITKQIRIRVTKKTFPPQRQEKELTLKIFR